MRNKKASKKESRLSESERFLSPSAADWFWRPWYAKIYLAMTVTYWIGFWIMQAIPYEQVPPYLLNAMLLLIFVFNPVTIVAILGNGFLKARVASGELLLVSGASAQNSAINPHTDPFDCRSGDLHLRHIGVIPD